MFKNGRKMQKSGKISKKYFFFKENLKILKYFFFCKQKNAILLVLPIEEISLHSDLFSPPYFRFQWGSPERDGQTDEGRKSLCLIRIHALFGVT